MNKERLIDRFVKYCACPSESYDEKAFAEMIEAELQQLGLETWRDEIGAQCGSNGFNVLLPLWDAQSFLWSPSAVAVAFSWYTHSSQTLSSPWVPTPTSEPRHPEHECKDPVLPFCYLFILVCLIVLLFLSSPAIFLCGLMT